MGQVKAIDFDKLTATTERARQALFGGESGGSSCTVNCIKTPPGDGSNAGRHFHPVDQIFYVISGTMTVDIGGKEEEAGPGSVVVFPARVPHRNWNRGSEPTIHIAINPPLVDSSEAFITQVPD